MILAQRRKHSKNSSSVKLSSSLVSASVFFQLPLKRASFQDIREERSVEQKTPADCVDES